MSKNRCFFLLSSILICAGSLLAQIDYYSPANIYSFADYLHRNGDYLRAAGEFQRFLFVSNSPNCDSILFKIGLCYELSDQPDISRNFYNKIIDNCPESKFFDMAQYEIAHTYFRSGDYIQSLNHIKNHLQKISTDDGRYRMNLLTGVNYLYERDWETAHDYFNNLSAINSQDSGKSVIKLGQLAIEGTKLKYKSMFLAGMFSAIIPGSGKIYAGRVNDGIYSFVMIGLTTWQTYDGFHNRGVHSIKGWIYGTLSTVLYAGNIYGSAIAIQLYNDKLDKNIISQIDIDLMWK